MSPEQIEQLIRELEVGAQATTNAPGRDLYTHGFGRGIAFAIKAIQRKAEASQ